MLQANPGLADKLLEHADDDKDVDGIPPIRSLALMHQAGLTLEQWNMVNSLWTTPKLQYFLVVSFGLLNNPMYLITGL